MKNSNICHSLLPADHLLYQRHNHHSDFIYTAFNRYRKVAEDAYNTYLPTMNAWLRLVTDTQLQGQLALLREITDPEPDICTLILCIYLMTQTPVPTTEEITTVETLYAVLKSFHTIHQLDVTPSISMNQAGLLLAIYEEVNGLDEVAYQSIGYCSRTGYIMGLDKTLCQRGPQSGAEEIAFDTHKHVWWCITILERYVLHEHIGKCSLLMVQDIFSPESKYLSNICMSRSSS
jgi:hypothetical protein